MLITVKLIEKLVKEAMKYRMEPLRYASTDVGYIKSGVFEGMLKVRKGAKPRKNGKVKVYLMYISFKEYMPTIKAWQKFIKFNKDKTYNVIMKTEKLKTK